MSDQPVSPERKWDFDRVFRLLLGAAIVLTLFALVRYLSDVLIPFAAALLLAYLLNPIVNALDSRFQRRTLSVLLTVFGTGMVAFSAAVVLVYIGSNEVASLRELTRQLHTPTRADVRNVRQAIDEFVEGETSPILKPLLVEARARLIGVGPDAESFRSKFDRYITLEVDPEEADRWRAVQARIDPIDAADRQLLREIDALLADETDPEAQRLLELARAELRPVEDADLSMTALLERAIRYIAPTLRGFFTGTLSFVLGLTGLVVVLLYLVFLLIDYPVMSATWRGFLPPKQRGDIVGFLEEFHQAMRLYFRGQFVIALTVGVLFAVGFSLIGLRMAVLLGLLIGLLNMVPYLQTVGLIPALLLGLIKGLESGQPVWLPPLLVLVVFAVVQTVQDALLTPKIMGKTVGLRPVVILLGIFIWGKLLGFLGLLLAIPFTCLGLAYYRRFVLGDRLAKVVET